MSSLIRHAAVLLLGFSTLFMAPYSFAQSDDFDLDELETYLDGEEDNFEKKRSRKKKKQKRKVKRKSDLADLTESSSFSDIAVIQPRFLVKTGRYEAFAGAAMLMNDAFFNNFGGNLKLAYYFSEKWGIEGHAFLLVSKEKKVTKSLADRQIVTQSLVTPKSYFGADLKWIPIYGKMAFFNKRIIPFDLYFSLGGGMTQTNQIGVSASAPTVKLGTGQLFKVSQNLYFRWDFSWHFFKPEVDTTQVSSSGSGGQTNNLFLLFGFSTFLGGEG